MTELWTAAGASIVGQSHVAGNKPCQDSVAVHIETVPNMGEVLLAAVSDGAGSAKLSELGSRIVCETFIELACETLRVSAKDLWTPAFFKMWHTICLEVLDTEAKRHATSRAAFAATALFAVATNERAMFFQIGDGAIVVSPSEDGRPSGAFHWVFWPDKGEEYHNVTTFVTSKNAIEKAEGCIYEAALDRIALFTDGTQDAALYYRNASAHPRFFERCFELFSTGSGNLEQEQVISTILASPSLAKTSHDDKSLILAVRHANA